MCRHLRQDLLQIAWSDAVVRQCERRVFGGVKVDEAAETIRMLGAKSVQDIAATRVPMRIGFCIPTAPITARMSSALRRGSYPVAGRSEAPTPRRVTAYTRN